MLQGDPEPGLGWELKGLTDEVSYDVCVKHHNLVAVSGLNRIRSVEILPRYDMLGLGKMMRITELLTFLKAASIWGSSVITGLQLDCQGSGVPSRRIPSFGSSLTAWLQLRLVRILSLSVSPSSWYCPCLTRIKVQPPLLLLFKSWQICQGGFSPTT